MNCLLYTSKALLHGSLVSPSLGAAIINGKYVNAVPLYRLEQEFQDVYKDVYKRQTLSRASTTFVLVSLSFCHAWLSKSFSSFFLFRTVLAVQVAAKLYGCHG